jgi:glutamate-ammonia-ligase adenylyltransferase
MDREKILSDTAEMREKISAAKGQGGEWEAKLGTGGIQDIELFTQAACLISGNAACSVTSGLQSAVTANLIDSDEAEAIGESYKALWTIQAVAKLLSDNPLDPERIGLGGLNFLLRECDAKDLDDLNRSLADYSAAAGAVIDRALGLNNGDKV